MFYTLVNNKSHFFTLLMFSKKATPLEKKLPFTIDNDVVCVFTISFDDESMVKILLYQMEMERKTENDAFELVANIFKEFIK